MPTGACGINCDVCGLTNLGLCSTCGPGTSQEARKKAAAQERLLGAPCPILACAMERRIAYCSRDCERFPCDRFRAGPYPFSHSYLDMNDRRRREIPEDRAPSGERIKVPPEYWDELEKRNMDIVCGNALAKPYPPKGMLLPVMGEYLLIDLQDRSVFRQGDGKWETMKSPLLELLCLVYLLNVGPEPLRGEMISVQELKCAHFFQGPHELRTSHLVRRYGRDVEGFRKAAELVGGESLELADAAYRFMAFPKIPLYYLLWEGDEEFPPRMNILFDRSIEAHLAADAIWGVVNMVSRSLISAHERP